MSSTSPAHTLAKTSAGRKSTVQQYRTVRYSCTVPKGPIQNGPWAIPLCVFIETAAGALKGYNRGEERGETTAPEAAPRRKEGIITCDTSPGEVAAGGHVRGCSRRGTCAWRDSQGDLRGEGPAGGFARGGTRRGTCAGMQPKGRQTPGGEHEEAKQGWLVPREGEGRNALRSALEDMGAREAPRGAT